MAEIIKFPDSGERDDLINIAMIAQEYIKRGMPAETASKLSSEMRDDCREFGRRLAAVGFEFRTNTDAERELLKDAAGRFHEHTILTWLKLRFESDLRRLGLP